jgi:hypothetical protein
MESFRADAGDEAPTSQAYLRYYTTGGPPVKLPGVVWQAGVCALTNEHAADYANCACAGLELGVGAGTH